jgi:hypothetical protein
MSRSTGRARAAIGKLADIFHDSVKQVVDVHGCSLLVVNSDCFPSYLPDEGKMCRKLHSYAVMSFLQNTIDKGFRVHILCRNNIAAYLTAIR